MKNFISKKSFLKKLRFYLSFSFKDEESTSILNDYEEWFDNEALQGKSEEEICTALNSPKKVVNRLLLESDKNPVQIHIFFQNTLVQFFLLAIIHLLISFLALKICDRNAVSYLYFAFGIVFIDFITGMILIKKNASPKVPADRKNFFKGNLFVFIFSVIVVLCEMLYLPKINHPGSGPIYVYLLSVMIVILVLANLYVAVKKIFESQQFVCFTTLHILGTVTLLFYMINQLHMLYHDIPEFISSVSYGVFIYIETIILSFIFLYAKKARKEGKQ